MRLALLEAAALLGKAFALFVPSGTMANQLAIRVQTKPGDEVIADSRADAGGILALETEQPLRLGYAAGTVVRWDKPLCYYRAQADATTWRYANRGLMATGMALDLVETWS